MEERSARNWNTETKQNFLEMKDLTKQIKTTAECKINTQDQV